MKNKERNQHSIFVFFIYLIGTLSYVTSLDIGRIKYIGIVITIIMVLSQWYLRNWVMELKKVMLFICLLAVLLGSAILQDTTLNQKAFSFFFYIVLLCWTLCGNAVFRKEIDILYAGFGISVGVIFGLAVSVDLVFAQLNSLYNYRVRLWGGFSHANQLGAIAAAGLIAICSYVFLTKRKMSFSMKIMFGSLLIVFYMTKSRTSWIVMLVFIAVYSLRNINRVTGKIRIFIYLAVLAAIAVIAYVFWTEYAVQDAAFAGRLEIFDKMIITPETFFVGNGMVDSSSLNRDNTNGGSMEIAWVMLFYKNGIIGIIAYIIIILNMILRVQKLQNRNQKWLFYALLMSFLVGSVGEAFLCNITNLSPMLEWILLSALSETKFYEDENIENSDYNEKIKT